MLKVLVNLLKHREMEVLYKSINSGIEDITEKGEVTIYVNSFDREDSDGDISAKGAFKKTITENFNRIKHFLNHDGRLLIGIPLEMQEDSFGLKVISKLNLKKEIGRDAYEDYKLYAENNRTLEHSIGFNVMKRDEKNKSIIKEYRLWEYSTLTNWGANEWTPMVGLKGMLKKEDIELLIEKYNRNYSDSKLKLIEQTLKSVDKNEPLEDTFSGNPIELINNFKQILNGQK